MQAKAKINYAKIISDHNLLPFLKNDICTQLLFPFLDFSERVKVNKAYK